MKLNPPDSSSDLEAARAIARRIHDRAHHQERSDLLPPAAPRPATAVRTADRERWAPEPDDRLRREPEPPVSEPESVAPPELEAPEADSLPPQPPLVADTAEPEAEQPEALDLASPEEPTAPDRTESPFTDPGGLTDPGGPVAPDEDDRGLPAVETTAFEPEPPEPEPPALDPEPEGLEDSPELDDPFLDASAFATDDPAPPEAAAAEDAWALEADDALSDLAGSPAEPSLEELEPPSAAYEEDPGAGVEDLLGGAPAEEQVPELPFDVVTDPGASESPDDLIGTPGPSWDDVAEACMALAGAHGSMLVNTSGQVLTARGQWPEPGPDAIAGRLVSMMERTLQEAPTRSVSAPIAGQHLTAWRIPAHEGYLTAVFMGDAPLSTDVRPGIDKHIRQALDR